MSENKENVPRIRFPGFTDAWEQRKLGDMGIVSTGNTPPTSEKENWSADNDGHVWITPTDIDALIMSDSERHLSDVGWAKARTVPAYSVLITSIASIGKNAVNTVPVAFNQQINAIVPKGNDAYFILSAMEKEKTRFEGLAGQTATAIINKTEFEKFTLPIPTIQEQQQVSDFFRDLDTLITLHQRKLNNIQNLKAGLLQKMFPKDGEDFPEARFPGFTDAWKQRRLGEIYTERKERGYDSLQILSVSIHHGVSDEELDSDTLGKKVRRSADKSLYKHVHFGDLVLNMMRAWQGAIGVVKSEGMVSPAYITAIPSAELYPLFMDYCLRRDEAIIQMDNLSYGVTDFRKRLYWDSFINVLCRIPSVPEQERITAFFSNLDHLITLHQRKLKHLQEQKKALLQQMFV